MTIFSMFLPIINMFRNTSEALVFFGEPIASLNFITILSLLFSIIFSSCITCFFYRHTGGTIHAANISLLGFSMKKDAEDIDEYNFKKIFKSIAKENIYIILDDIDRVEKKKIGEVLAFIELLKESAEAVRYESMKNNRKIIISTCVPANNEQLCFLLRDVVIDTQYKIVDTIINDTFITDDNKYIYTIMIDRDKTADCTNEFMHKIFMKIYETNTSPDDVVVILQNKELDKATAEKITNEAIKSCFHFIININLRQTSRYIEEYFELLKLYNKNSNLLKATIKERDSYKEYLKVLKDGKSSVDDKLFTELITLIAVEIRMYLQGNKISFKDVKQFICENNRRNKNISIIFDEIDKSLDIIKTEIDKIKSIENKVLY